MSCRPANVESRRCIAKANHESGRKTKIILRIAEETSLQIIALHAPGNCFCNAKVGAAAESRRKGSVRKGEVGASGARVCSTEERLGKGGHFPDRYGGAGTDQERVDVGVSSERA